MENKKPKKRRKIDYHLKDRASDDITFCMADCRTVCARKPVNIRYREHPHSFADFSNTCSSYKPSVQAVINNTSKKS